MMRHTGTAHTHHVRNSDQDAWKHRRTDTAFYLRLNLVQGAQVFNITAQRQTAN